MKNPQLKLNDLVNGLELFGERYEALEVFADDVLEMRSDVSVPGLSPADLEGRVFQFRGPNGRAYEIRVIPEAGVIRVARVKASDPPPSISGSSLAAGALAGAAVGAALS